MSKLSREDVLNIKKALSEGVTHIELSELYGVTKCSITNIATGKTWAHVEGPKPLKTAYDKLGSEIVEDIVSMRSQGVSGVDIAARLGLGTTTVYRYLRKAGYGRDFGSSPIRR